MYLNKFFRNRLLFKIGFCKDWIQYTDQLDYYFLVGDANNTISMRSIYSTITWQFFSASTHEFASFNARSALIL